MSTNGDKRPRFNQLPQEERQQRVRELQQGVEPTVDFVLEIRSLSNKQIALGAPDGALDSVGGCAMAQDVLAKAIRVVAAKLAKLSDPAEERRIKLAMPGAVPPYQG